MSRKRKRLNHDDRLNIQGCLNMGRSFSYIARRYGWHRSTISREVRRGRVVKEGTSFRKCPDLGKRFTVCNQCPRKDGCRRDRVYYDFTVAADDAHRKKHESHEGPRIGTGLFGKIDEEVFQGVKAGRSIEHIHRFGTYAGKVSCLTLRRWIGRGYMKVKRPMLRHAAKYSRAYSYTEGKKAYPAHIAGKAGRTMSDFRQFTEGHPDALTVEQDSVEGKATDSVRILTQMIVSCSFQIGTVYETSKASESVLAQTERLAGLLLSHLPDREIVFLCDNGPEFYGVEKAEEVSPRVHVFFTHPYRSTDKAHCERKHELFRFVVPKRTSFDGLKLGQETVSEIFSNIDSYATEGTEWKRPCDLVAEAISPDFPREVGIRTIDDNDVRLARIK